MSDRPINLNRARKARARAAAKAQADENAVRFGLTKGERQAGKASAATLRARLEAHRRETPDGE